MKKIPHLVEMQEKFAKRGFTIYSVNDDPSVSIEKHIKQYKINYLVAKSSFFFANEGWNTDNTYGRGAMFIIDPEGVIEEIYDAPPEDEDIEKLLAKIPSPTITEKMPKELDKIVKSYNKGEYGKALTGAQKLSENDENSDETTKGIERLKELIELQKSFAAENISRLQEGERYLELKRCLERVEKRFKGLELGDDATARLKKLDEDKEVKAQIKDLELVEKYLKALWTAKDDKARTAPFKKLKSFLKKNKDSKAAEWALFELAPVVDEDK